MDRMTLLAIVCASRRKADATEAANEATRRRIARNGRGAKARSGFEK